MTRWEDVLDTQQQLWSWWRTAQGHSYAETFGTDQALKHGHKRDVQAVQETTLFHAEPIAIDPDMMTLIEAAQRTFQPEPLRAEDLITEAGFLVLPRPLVTKDIWRKTVSYRAVAWMPALRTKPVPQSPALEVASALMGWGTETYGIHVSLYTHIDDPDDYPVEDKEAMRAVPGMPDLTLAHQEVWTFGHDYTVATPEDFEGMHEAEYYTEHGVDIKAAIESYVFTRRSIQAMFRLLNQTIAVRSSHRPERSTRRRALRLSYPPKDVTVIHLRRPRSTEMPLDPGGKHVEWSHRWIVAGHWRNQYYATLGEHRQIWISPFVKGPPDKELVVREKRAFVLSR